MRVPRGGSKHRGDSAMRDGSADAGRRCHRRKRPRVARNAGGLWRSNRAAVGALTMTLKRMDQMKPLFRSVLAAALMSIAGVAMGSAQAVNACYVPNVGAIYLVGLTGLPTACLSTSHVAIALGGASLPDGSVSTAKIVDGAITGPKIGHAAVGAGNIASGAIQPGNIAAGAVMPGNLAPNAVGTGQIAPNAVGSSQIAAGAVGSAQVADNSLGATDLASGAVGN